MAGEDRMYHGDRSNMRKAVHLPWRRWQFWKQLCTGIFMVLFTVWVMTMVSAHLYYSMPDGDLLSLFRGTGGLSGGALMLQCARPTPNVSRILQEKFALSSRHRLTYRLRHDDILPDVPFPPDNVMCERYVRDWRRTWPVVRNVFDAYIRDHQGITLVTQLSLDRVAPFRQTLKHWKGAVSAAVYFTENRTVEFLETMSQLVGSRCNVFVHAVIQGEEYFYPGNFLRNIAAENTGTEFVFLLDGDFVPNVMAEKRLYKHRWALEQQQVLVAPAFAFLRPDPDPDLDVLDSKQQLLNKIHAPRPAIKRFDQYSFYPGHRRTNYTRWETATGIYEVGFELGFEPYVLMFATDVGHYPETFLGLLHDKSSFFTLLRLKEFRFQVLPDVYVVHYSHSRSRSDKREKDCVFHLFRSWRHEMFVMYGVDPLHWKDNS